jgi:hypothetical protein
VAAEALEVLGARGQACVEVERRHGAARSLPRVLAPGDHHDRPVEPLDEPRRDDPDHPLVPVGAGEDVRPPPLLFLGPLLHRRDGLAQDPVLDLLPLAVQLLEPRSQPRRLLAVGGQEQLERCARMPEPAGSIDARRQPEADRAGVHDRGIDPRGAHQRLEARLLRAGERAEARARERTVLVEQRDDVGDRGQRDQVEVPVDVRAERTEQLVDDAGAAELGERVRRRPRRDDRAVGQRLRRTVVVGDDHVEPEALRFPHLDVRGDPTVDGEHEAVPVSGQTLQRLARDPVPFVEAAREVPVDVGTEVAQARDRQGGRADAVDVVVAVDADALARVDRGAEAVARGRRVAEQRRIVPRRLCGEERPCGLGVAVPAPDEDAGGDPADPERLSEGARLTVRAGTDRPRALLHRALTVRTGSDGVRFRPWTTS